MLANQEKHDQSKQKIARIMSIQNTMNFKISVVLLFVLATTLPFGRQSMESFSVMATNINENQTQANIEQLATSTQPILSETCTDRFCYNLTSEHMNAEIDLRSTAIKGYDHYRSYSILYSILEMASDRYQSNQCHRELRQMYHGIHRKDIWAMKALDSSGSPGSGFVLGNNFWLGSMQGCEAVQRPQKLTLSNRFQRFMHSSLLTSTAPFDMEYRVVYAEHRSPWQIQVEFLLDKIKILHIGLCIPMSCSNEQVFNMTQEYFNTAELSAKHIYDYQPNVLKVKDLHMHTNFLSKRSFQILGFCVLFTIVMMIIAYIKEDNRRDDDNLADQITSNLPTTSAVITSTASPTLLSSNPMAASLEYAAEPVQNPPDIIMQCQQLSMPEKSVLSDFIECFSIQKNMSFLFSVRKTSNAVPIIDALKSIGAFLILIFHVSWYMHYTSHNSSMIFVYGEQMLWQWVGTTPIIVDAFFTISGLLLAYNFLRNEAKLNEIRENSFGQNIKLFGKQLLHRYIRLSPLYLVIVGFMEIITSHMLETSLFWIHDRYDITCSKYWWRNIFYVQNLFDVSELCVTWSWSLACEMQFFILFTALLFIYAKYPNAAKALFCLLFGVFSALVFAIAMFTKFTPAYDVMHSLGKDLYISPWARVLPYLVGVASGYIMYSLNGVLSLGEKAVKIMWTITTSLAILAHISTIDRGVSHIVAAPLITAIRIFYSASLCWMIVASQTGHGGSFTRIMNSPVFVHLNKLSYAVYLLNPLLITVIYGYRDHSSHVDPITMSIMTLGIMVACYIASVVFAIMFEIPYTNLSIKILKQSQRQTNPSHNKPAQLKKTL